MLILILYILDMMILIKNLYTCAATAKVFGKQILSNNYIILR
jgi:hypothetical protein